MRLFTIYTIPNINNTIKVEIGVNIFRHVEREIKTSLSGVLELASR